MMINLLEDESANTSSQTHNASLIHPTTAAGYLPQRSTGATQAVPSFGEDSTQGIPSLGEGSGSTSVAGNRTSDLDSLNSIYSPRLTPSQIKSVYELYGESLELSSGCLADGPSTASIIKQMKKMAEEFTVIKVRVDEDDLWSDLVSFYKSAGPNAAGHCVRIRLLDQPPIDTGGVRRQIYTQTLKEFEEIHVRPFYSAEARSSGMFRVLGVMVGHSIQQDGIGFPYLSPLCFDYIALGEEHALQHCSLNDVNDFAKDFIVKVHVHVCV